MTKFQVQNTNLLTNKNDNIGGIYRRERATNGQSSPRTGQPVTRLSTEDSAPTFSAARVMKAPQRHLSKVAYILRPFRAPKSTRSQ